MKPTNPKSTRFRVSHLSASLGSLVSLLALVFAPSVVAAQVPPPPATYGGSGTIVVPDYGTTAGPSVGVVTPAVAVPQPRLVTEERSSSIKGLWLPGMIVLPVAWVMTWSIATAAFPESETASLAWVPVIGPWLMLGTDVNGAEGGIILSGVVQGIATLALVLGLSIRRTRTVQHYVIDPPGGGPPITVSFGGGPMQDGGAVWLDGRF